MVRNIDRSTNELPAVFVLFFILIEMVVGVAELFIYKKKVNARID